MSFTASSPLRVLIVADDWLTRAGLAALLAHEPECAIIGQVAGEDDLPAVLEAYRPDAVLWDLGWEPELALKRLADLNDILPPTVVLLFNEDDAPGAYAAGAQGLLLRHTDAKRLTAALIAISQGLIILDPTLAPLLLKAFEQRPPPEELTPRERQVLQLLAEGLSNKAIAQRLGISEHTVKFHVNSILGKLDAQSRTEAVIRATRLGLIIL
jgi:two-component system nitrate/nitrite response regulator NarL